ncbi:hypothetical protein TRFO_35434 [Tritrichomonas foetus]|uniref:NOT2/NOT3/NOT5 C-terminal domain-containing protein n=1 Tax=Tritrichomonas foetus TaxID=1144522 RepID=A0A1J4JIQ7_9EUKA|nr:hypothetical protein TRFO_35434 [Tritrichomonas foetus]|eukprot:OHS98231.1 hypothetical protein TRFO_35434 [Tritrichomonas foetus]
MNKGSIPRKPQEKKRDAEDFSALISLPRMGPSLPTNHPAQMFQPIDVKIPENLLQTDPTQQDYEKALFSSFDLIPDVPYELHDYEPQNPADVPPYFPKLPNMKLFQPEFLKNYDLNTLFYIFFYFPGTTQQFFAGKELKKRNWVYHKVYQTWYHRLSEPSEKTDEYEIAKFEYFDHHSQEWWRIKQSDVFKLEYSLVDCD